MILLAHASNGDLRPAISGTGELLQATWNWDPWVLIPMAIGMGLYLWWVRFQWNKQTALFIVGNLIIFTALISPIANIGETYLFSVHMLQHLLLTLVAVPLLILGIPKAISQRLLRIKWFRRVTRPFGYPIVAWIIGVGTLWIWHLPLLYNLTLVSEWIHAAEHVCFVVSATIFWNAVLDPVVAFRLKTGQAIVYIFSAGLVNSLLAIMLTFAPTGFYKYYQQPTDRFGALNLIRQKWGIGFAMDQEMGGALMWVMGSFVGLLLVIGLMAHWFRKPDKDFCQEFIRG